MGLLFFTSEIGRSRITEKFFSLRGGCNGIDVDVQVIIISAAEFALHRVLCVACVLNLSPRGVQNVDYAFEVESEARIRICLIENNQLPKN